MLNHPREMAGGWWAAPRAGAPRAVPSPAGRDALHPSAPGWTGKLGRPRAQLFYSRKQRLVEAKSSSTLVPPCFELKLLGSEAVTGSSPPVPAGSDPQPCPGCCLTRKGSARSGAGASLPLCSFLFLLSSSCSGSFGQASRLSPAVCRWRVHRGGVQRLLEGTRSIYV